MTGIGQLAGLGYSFAAGSLTTLSPCVFPILPLVIGGAVQANRLAPVAMGAGMALSFAAIGMALGLLGPALGIDGDSVRTAGAAYGAALGVMNLCFYLSIRTIPLGIAVIHSSTRSIGIVSSSPWRTSSGTRREASAGRRSQSPNELVIVRVPKRLP